ncbi:MAG: TonB-dependent receptor [bacterium]|nr:TonB-dependent receptor [bacterium]
MKNKTFAIIVFAIAFTGTMRVKAQFTLSGKVTTAQGEAVPFAALGILHTQLATTSGDDGNFKFNGLKKGTLIVAVRCIGFADRTDTIELGSDLVHDFILQESNKKLDEVVVNASRVDKNSGMAYNDITAETIKKQNLGQDAPYMLNQLPNVVVNSDAGNGVGYTGIRIRGSDGTRINVTINGVPVNDAESQGTYFVDMPDLVSSVNNIQVQRGVGTSANGAGAFGASINFQTNELKDKPYANVIATGGSFGTLRKTIAAGTGLMSNKFTLDARASAISSDGYVDRASSDLKSYYIAAGYYGKKTVMKFINFLGLEKTYQAWNYVPEDSLKAGNRTYNSCGEYFDANGATKYYSNETDNYKQNNFQLHVIHQLNSRLNFNVTGHYTKGAGYYEQYKNPAKENSVYGDGAKFSTYGLPNVVIGGDTITETNLIRRLWLDNDFAGGIFNFNYRASSKLALTLGGGYNTYYGLHDGRIIWAQYASTSELNYEYDKNSANKNDGNLYLKTNYKPMSAMNVFVDLQVRKIDYRFQGFDNTLTPNMQNQKYTFFNPKLGLSYNLNSQVNAYASFAVANKEPNRDDFVQSSPQSRPKSEQLYDLEAGVKYVSKSILLAANFYDMQYKNQLVLNGQINNVGNYNRVNVDQSYRRGLELEASGMLNKFFSLSANLSLSTNKILNFVEYTDSLSGVDLADYTQNKVIHKTSDISFSPNVVSSLLVKFSPFHNFDVTLTGKSVGKQFLDNTSNENRCMKAYEVLNAGINYKLITKAVPEINFMLSVNNILNTNYVTNGYTYSYYTGPSLNTFNFLAPSAPINFLAGVNIRF